MSSSQDGLVSGRDTSSLLDVFFNVLHSSFDNHSCICVLLLDVVKVFNSANHQILL